MYDIINSKVMLNLNGSVYTCNVDLDTGFSFEDPRTTSLKRGSMGEGVRRFEGGADPFVITITVENVKNSLLVLFRETFSQNLKGLGKFTVSVKALNSAGEEGEWKFFNCVFNKSPRQTEITQDAGKIELVIHSVEEEFVSL